MGIVNGATATTFDPNGNVTREQIAAILYRYEGSPTVTGGNLRKTCAFCWVDAMPAG